MTGRPLSIALFHNLPSGGAKRAVYDFARELTQHGHRLTEIRLDTADPSFLPLTPVVAEEWAVPFARAQGPRLRVRGLNTYLQVGTALTTLRRLDRVSRALAKSVDDRHFDLVFAHDCLIAMKPPILQYLRTPTIYYCHHSARGVDYAFNFGCEPLPPVPAGVAWRQAGYRAAWRYYWRTFSRLERHSARAATRVLTNSCFAREAYFRDFGVSAQVASYGLDSEAFRPAAIRRAGYVLSVGELTYRKGYRFLVRALATIPQAQRPRLVILANTIDPDEYGHVSALAGRLGVDINVRQVGDHQELVAYYSAAEMLVYTPIMEALGLAALEAMACATPVVAVAEGGPRETVVDGVTGLLVPRDEAAFAGAVMRLLGDHELRDRLGRAARAEVSTRWTWQRAGEVLEGHLRRVTENHVSQGDARDG